MRYHDALRYLYELVDYEKKRIERYSPHEFKLERVEHLLHALGDPHKAYPTIHVAGTKGKGSVSSMLHAIAQAGKQRCGLYVSPHLHTFRERIQINGDPISRRAMADLVEEIQPSAAAIPELTTFEVTTALAFLYFARQNVDIAVMEVGLGGRLDATNVITPEVSIITSLSLDHTELLGNTLAEIAYEKGGIIKPGIPLVSAPQKPEALEVLKNIAAERHSPITVVGEHWNWTRGQQLKNGQSLHITTTKDKAFEGEYNLSLIGEFQQENATTMIAATEVLKRRGFSWATPENVHAGLVKVSWPGRMEILQKDPPLMVDCAHNPYSTQTLVHSLKTWFPDTQWILIYGASSNKDIPGMLDALLPVCPHVIVTRSYHPRATAPYTLADHCANLGRGAEIALTPQRALEKALEKLEPGWGIIATGSIFIVADIREAWSKKHSLALPQGDWTDEPW